MRNLIELFILFSIFSFSITGSYGQREISGKVMDFDTGKPIKDVTVKVRGFNGFALTDSLGEYQLSIPDTIKSIEFSDLSQRKIQKVEMLNPNRINLYFTSIEMDLFEMTLEELMDMEVTTVSKKSQSISKAPAVVTIIKQNQIENYGVKTLTELMTYIPGFSVKDTYWKRQIVTSRGVTMSLYNDKILMLVNGIPAYGAAAMEHFLDLIPITSVKQIEVIRGPGSTLYGTNAFSAVINVITKDGKAGKDFSAYAGVGSFETKESGFSFSDNVGEFIYHLGATYHDDDGYKKKDILDEDGNTNDMIYEFDNSNLFTSISFRDFTVNAGYLYQRWAKFGPLPRFWAGHNNHLGAGGRAYHDKYFVNGMFSKDINEKLDVKFSLHYDFIDKQIDIGQFGLNIYQYTIQAIDTTTVPDYYRFGGQLYQAEAQLHYQLAEHHSLIVGFSGESRETRNLADLYTDLNGSLMFEGSTQELPFAVNDFGGYAQFDGELGKLGYVAGIRYSYLGVSEKAYLTPRAGLVYNVSGSTSIKALYGNAFRGPGPQEQYYKVPILIYGLDAIDKGLEPEQINTFELAVDQKFLKRYKIRANAFMLNINELINRRPATQAEIQLIDPNLPSTLIYDNLGDKDITGFEIELNGYPTDNLNFWGNISYKDGEVLNEDTVTFDYLPFVEKITANGGISLKLFKSLTIAPNYQYVGERKGELSSDPGTTQSVDAYGIMNLVIINEINKQLKLQLNLKNLLDEEYYYPEDIRQNILKIPGGPGRFVYITLKYNMQ